MQLVTIEQVRLHCKADAADDTELVLAANAAEAMFAKLANRNVYTDQAALDAGLATISADMIAANAAYTTAMDAALGLDALDRAWEEDVARKNLRDATTSASMKINGIVVTDDIISAILLLTGHFYRNREEVNTSAGATAVTLPLGAERIANLHRALGPL